MPHNVLRPQTRLSRELRMQKSPKRVTPLDAFQLAMRKWLKSEPIEIASLAKELGIGRATLFRWVGSRELLLGEVIWSLYEQVWRDALSSAKGEGAEFAANVIYELLQSLVSAEPLHRFIEADPEYALRILTSNSSTVQARIIEAVRTELLVFFKPGTPQPALPIDDLAYVLVRIGESCLYADRIVGRKPNLEAARDAIRILVAARG